MSANELEGLRVGINVDIQRTDGRLPVPLFCCRHAKFHYISTNKHFIAHSALIMSICISIGKAFSLIPQSVYQLEKALSLISQFPKRSTFYE